MTEEQKTLVGKVMHYFGGIGVAALSLNGELKVGDRICIERKDGERICELKIDSMQIERKDVNEAKAGDDVAIKVPEKVHNGNLVYKL